MDSDEFVELWDAITDVLVRLTWLATIVLFLLKLTRWIDWSWWSILLPAAGYVGICLVVAVLSALWFGVTEREPKRGARPQDYDVSHIEPLDSIKNPRKS